MPTKHPSLDRSDEEVTDPGTALDDLRRTGGPSDGRLVPSIPSPSPAGDGPTGSPMPKRKNPVVKWLVRGVLLAVLGTLAGGAALAGVVLYYRGKLPQFASLKDYNPPENTKIFAGDGAMFAEIPGQRERPEGPEEQLEEEDVDPKSLVERRTVVPYDDIPSVLIQALTSAEDADFFHHSGIDYVGIAKAMVQNVLHPGQRARGASTLTQQVAKQLVGAERSLSRKIKEAILAKRLEENLKKEDILYIYLNEIYVGNRRYGMEEAARFYFGHGVKEITLGEAAVLASIPKDPNNMNPRRNMARVKERQSYVLRRMAENGYITKEVAEREVARPIQLAPLPEAQPGGYYVEEVKRIVSDQLGEDALKRGGLRIETMMDPALQRAAEGAVKRGLRDLDKRQGYRGPLGHVDDETWERVRTAALESLKKSIPKGQEAQAGERLMDVRPLEFKLLASGKLTDQQLAVQVRAISWKKREVDTELVARVDKVTKTAALVDLGTSKESIPFGTTTWARAFNPTSMTAAPKGMTDVLSPGDLVLVRVAKITACEEAARAKGKCDGPKVDLALEQNPKVESALVSIDPRTRAVLALVGGYDVHRSPFNRATQAKRQPGSSFKPFVYAAALDVGQQRALLARDGALDDEQRSRCIVFTPRQKVYDTPELIRDRWTGKPWQPRNFERDFFAGEMSLRKALAESKNTVAVKLIADIGCEPAAPMSYEDMQQSGLQKVKDLAKRAGIDSPIPDSLTAALGSGEVIPLELVNAYATFAAQGKWTAPQLVKRIRNAAGETLWEAKPVVEQAPPLMAGLAGAQPPPRGLRPELAFITGEVMRSVVEDPDGTARSMQRLGRPIAGKTGTASEHRDAWFVGFTPEVVTGVWVGFDDHEMLGPRETGGHAAGPIWLEYMQAAEDKVEHLEFEPPMGVVTAQIDPRTGLLADEHSPFVEREVYLQGTEPTEVSPPTGEAKTEDFLRDGP